MFTVDHIRLSRGILGIAWHNGTCVKLLSRGDKEIAGLSWFPIDRDLLETKDGRLSAEAGKTQPQFPFPFTSSSACEKRKTFSFPFASPKTSKRPNSAIHQEFKIRTRNIVNENMGSVIRNLSQNVLNSESEIIFKNIFIWNMIPLIDPCVYNHGSTTK